MTTSSKRAGDREDPCRAFQCLAVAPPKELSFDAGMQRTTAFSVVANVFRESRCLGPTHHVDRYADEVIVSERRLSRVGAATRCVHLQETDATCCFRLGFLEANVGETLPHLYGWTVVKSSVLCTLGVLQVLLELCVAIQGTRDPPLQVGGCSGNP